MTTQNQALSDELQAVNSIYNAETCVIKSLDQATGVTSTVLALPDLPITFLITFPSNYPDAPPDLVGTQSTGPSTKIGQGEAASNLVRDVLGSIFIPGQVCLFDLIEEVTPLLKQDLNQHSGIETNEENAHYDTIEDQPKSSAIRSAHPSTPSRHISTQLRAVHIQDQTLSDTAPAIPKSLTEWTTSEALVVNRSTFIGRALAVRSLQEATDSLSYLLASNKRVASATHNITAWRIKQTQSAEPKDQTGKSQSTTEIVIQDCDDDGETAAGGRLLHLMQLMDVWNVVVVVTRWYGGVKLGPDRFRCINSVAREALVTGGFGKEEHEGKAGGRAKGKKK